MKKVMMIDIDGVVCEHIDNEQAHRMSEAEPYKSSIEKINTWYDEGHFICFFTARTDEHAEATHTWLKNHDVKHHRVIFNKPRVVDGSEYHYIDDRPIRATRFKGSFSEFVKKDAEVLVFEGD